MAKLIFAVVAIVFLTDHTKACGGGSNSGRGLSTGNGEARYTFKNGVQVFGTGTISPPSGTVGVRIPIGKRKRRSTEKDEKNEYENKCNKCLTIDDFAAYDSTIANVVKNTKAELVFKAELQQVVTSISHVSISFKVVDVYRTPDQTIQPGETFSIDADLAFCNCITTVTNGNYIVTGKKGIDGKLVVDGNLIKM